jgi:diphthamide synthase subunit DPH2
MEQADCLAKDKIDMMPFDLIYHIHYFCIWVQIRKKVVYIHYEEIVDVDY